MGLGADGRIAWRCHLRSAPEAVYEMLDTAEGRERFWAAAAPEVGGAVEFRFSNGQTLTSKIVKRDPGKLFQLRYFNGSTVTFVLRSDGAGGTELTLTEEAFAPEDVLENLAGWISVLLGLKAAVDFRIDLRNHRPGCTWESGFVDV